MVAPPDIDRDAVAATLAAQVGELAAEPYTAPGDGVTRHAFTAPYERTVARVAELMRIAGLEPSRDAIGNLVGRPPGAGRGVGLGSHLDSVRGGGAWDGTVGVLAGIEAARLARELGLGPPRVVSWVEEEGSGFGELLLGSRVATGDLALAALDATVRSHDDRRSFSEHRAAACLPIDRGDPPSQIVDELDAWVELHIEQGRALEDAGASLGIVTAIAGYLHADIVLSGRADHAGATPMDLRADALVVAAQAVIAAERAARAQGHGTVATVGVIETSPGQINIVPQRVYLTLDVRSPADEAVSQVYLEVVETARAAATMRGVTMQSSVRQRRAATRLDDATVGELIAASHAVGVEPMPIVSGAAHDTMCLASRVPAAMLFIPCRDGVSHSPREHADPAHAALATQVLVRWLAMHDRRSPTRQPMRRTDTPQPAQPDNPERSAR